MTPRIQDMLVDLSINSQTGQLDLPDDGLAYLEELLVDAELLNAHIAFVARLPLRAEPISQAEVGDILLRGLRCQSGTLLVRLLFNASALQYIATLISGYVEELNSMALNELPRS